MNIRYCYVSNSLFRTPEICTFFLSYAAVVFELKDFDLMRDVGARISNYSF